MELSCFLLGVAPLLTTSSEQLSWEEQSSGAKASLRGLCVVGRGVAWASGAGGAVLRTTDGATWESRPIPGADELDFRDVEAFDADSALVLSAGAPTRMYRTDDGGASWRLVYENTDERAFFDALDFWGERRGLAFSDPVDGRLLVIATTDGGRNWRALGTDRMPPALDGEAGFAASGTCLATFGATDAWIGLGGTAGSRVFRTNDAGASWSVAATPIRSGEPSTGVFSIAFLDELRGAVVGGDYARPEEDGACAAFTLDGGASWSPAEPGPGGYRSCVAVVPRANERLLVAVGPGGTDVSPDGGRTWTRAAEEGFHAIAAGPDGSAWAVGSEGRIARLAPSASKAPGAEETRTRRSQ